MKNFFALLLFILVKLLPAQMVSVPYDDKKFGQVLNSKTLVVLVGDTAYDNPLKKAVEKYWNVTKYQFIEMKEIDNYIADENKTFLLPFVITVKYTHSAGSSFSDYSKLKSWLTVLLGGKKKLSEYTDSDVLAVAAFNYYGNEQDYVKCAYRLNYMVKGINDAIIQTKERKIEGGSIKVLFNGMDVTNEKSVNALSNKTLIVNKDIECWYNGKKVIEENVFEKAKYPFKYKLVSEKEYKDYLNSNDPNILCLCVAIEVNKHVLVYEPSTKKTVYYGWAMQGLDLGKKDIKSLAEGKR